MKRLLTLLALVLCSCAETFVGEEVARPNNENLPDLTAAFAEDETRTYVENNKYLRWHEDDRLTAFYGNTLNRQYKFNGATGDNSGTFSLVPSGELGTGNAFDHIYALYPYNADAHITDEGVISLTLPAEQNYAENSFGRGANTMLAVTENLEDTFLAFKNACGYLKIKLYNAEGATIKSIEVKGNSGERLAGAATATIAFGEAPVLAMVDDATTSVTLNCGEGVALGTTAETATEFWIVLPATTFAEGLTITATDTEGGVFEKSTTNEVIIERNAIQPMAAVKVECINSMPSIPNDEIWYTATQKCSVMNNSYNDSYGANLVIDKCVWDEDTGKGIIKFDGPINRIKSEAFITSSDYITSITLPESIIEIKYRAFVNCKNLKEINIPNGVTTIGISAFAGCSSLTSIKIPQGITTIRESLFSGCKNLTEILLPNSLTSIEASAFSECQSLENIKLPENLTSLGNSAFYRCSKLQSISIPDGVTTIGTNTFYLCWSLETLTIGKGVVLIDKNATYNCSKLKEVYCTALIPPALYFYDGYDSAFPFNNDLNMKIYVPHTSYDTYMQYTSYTSAYCSQINWSRYQRFIEAYDFENGEVVLPEPKPAANEIWYTTTDSEMAELAYAVTNNINPAPTQSYRDDIGCYVVTFSEECYDSSGLTNPRGFSLFDNNSKNKIKTLQFSNGDRLFDNFVNDVGAWGASEMTSLEEINIPDNVTYIRERLFSYLFDLKRVIIGSNVTSIESGAFEGCRGITSITLPENLESIGSLALWDTGITELIIPDKVQTLYTGNVPRSVVSLTIGYSVTNVKEDVWTTRDLSVVYCKPTTPPDNLKFLFYDIDRDMTVYVPTNSVDAYRTILDQYDRVTVEEYDF